MFKLVELQGVTKGIPLFQFRRDSIKKATTENQQWLYLHCIF